MFLKDSGMKKICVLGLCCFCYSFGLTVPKVFLAETSWCCEYLPVLGIDCTCLL